MDAAPMTAHPWRTHWSALSLAGKKIAFAGRPSKPDRAQLQAIIEPEGGVIVEEISPDVAVMVITTLTTNTTPAQRQAEQLNKTGSAAIEILPLLSFYERLLPTRDEAIEMLRLGPAARERWEELTGVPLGKLRIDLTNADLRGCDLSGFDLNPASLDGADLREANLAHAKLPPISDAKLDDARFLDTHVAGVGRCSFTEAAGPRLRIGRGIRAPGFADSDFTRARLPEAAFVYFESRATQFIEADLTQAVFVRSKLSGSDCSRAILRRATLSKTPCDSAVFAGADLSYMEALGGSFQKADFRGANLTGANFYEANLTQALFDGADVTDANFTRATITTKQLATARGTPTPERSSAMGSNVVALDAAMRQAATTKGAGGGWLEFSIDSAAGRRKATINTHRAYGAVNEFRLSLSSLEGTREQPFGSIFAFTGSSLADVLGKVLACFGPTAVIDPYLIVEDPKANGPMEVISAGLCEAFGVPSPTPEERAAAVAAKKKQQVAVKKALLAELRGGATGVQAFNARSAGDGSPREAFGKADVSQVVLDGLVLEKGLEFNGARFDGSSLVGVRVAAIDMKKATFTGAAIRDAQMAAVLKGASFDRAVLENVDFAKADLNKATFKQATLTRCRFYKADLCGADFSQANCHDCDWRCAMYDELTLLPQGFSHGPELRWIGQGPPPHELEAERRHAAAALAVATLAAKSDDAESQHAASDNSQVSDLVSRPQRRADFMAKVKQNVDKAKIDKALKMLKAERFELFVDVKEDHLVGVVKSQSDPDLVYACRLASDGSYQCCTQNLNVCGGLRGTPCKHLLVLAVGLERSDAMPPETLGLWIASSRNRQTPLDKEKMGEVLLRYKSAQVGEVDWRPTETTPEDFYAF